MTKRFICVDFDRPDDLSLPIFLNDTLKHPNTLAKRVGRYKYYKAPRMSLKAKHLH